MIKRKGTYVGEKLKITAKKTERSLERKGPQFA